ERDQWRKAEPIRIGVAAALRHRLPEIITEAVGVLGAVVAEMAEAVVAIDHEFHRGGAAGTGNPDRRMRLLDRPWPEGEHRQLIVPAVPGEDLLCLPGLQPQLQRFAVALALLHWDDRV